MSDFRICDSCLVCKHFRAEANSNSGVCYRYPKTSIVHQNPAHVCGEFVRDALTDMLETSKIITLLEGRHE